MAHAQPRCRPDMRPASSAMGRRHFLHAGAACVVPLLAGTTLGRTALAWPIAGPAQAADYDATLDHISRELVGVCKGMQGVEGVKGEHVRALAANLDLLAVRLRERGQDRRLEETLKEGVGRSGRDVFAQELVARQAEVIAALARRHRIANRVRLDLGEAASALDVAQRHPFTYVCQRSAHALVRTATGIDRARQRQGVVVRAAGQKAGDDFLLWGSQPEPVLTCKDLNFLIHFMALSGGLMGLFGLGFSGAVSALIAEALSIIYDWVCTLAEAH